MNAAALPEGYPQFFASAEGCRLTDVDGRSFVDLMCAWGPIILGPSQSPWWRQPRANRRCGAIA